MNRDIYHHFLVADPVLAEVFKKNLNIGLKPSKTYFSDLVESIVNQQLSEKAGATIWQRLRGLFKGGLVTPEKVAGTSVEILRKSGISYAKAGYIRNVALAFIDESIHPKEFISLSDEEIINRLTQVKGIGRWTAEMFLIFSLARPDVFSYGDIGLMRAIQKLYGGGKSLTRKRLEKIVAKWSPYRSYACLLLWRSLE